MNGKQFITVAVIAAVLALIVGMAASRLFSPKRALAQDAEITAQKMALVDSEGNLRVLLDASGERPAPAINFYETNGTHRAGYSLNENNESVIVMNNAAGEMRLAAGVTIEGGPAMLLKDASGKTVWKAPEAAKPAQKPKTKPPANKKK